MTFNSEGLRALNGCLNRADFVKIVLVERGFVELEMQNEAIVRVYYDGSISE
jgi:hypothetical protein